MLQAIEGHKNAAMLLFCGDGIMDFTRISYEYPRLPVRAVRGNCDFGSLDGFPEEDFFTELGKRVFRYAMNLDDEGEAEDINLLFTPEEVGRITKIKLSRMKLSDNGDFEFSESVKMLKDSMNKKSIGALSSVGDLDKFLNSMRNKK